MFKSTRNLFLVALLLGYSLVSPAPQDEANVAAPAEAPAAAAAEEDPLEAPSHVRDSINNYIHHLDYNPDVVLAFEGKSQQVLRPDAFMDGKKFILITREKKTVQNHQSDLGMVSSLEHVVYPGNLLEANQRLIDNQPTEIKINRAPMQYTVNFPGNYKITDFRFPPSFNEYMGALNEATHRWLEGRGGDYDLIAQFQMDYSFVYSDKQMEVKFGSEIKYMDNKLNVNFEDINKGEKSVLIMKFKQVFFTVSVEPPQDPSDLFDENVRLDVIRRKMNAQNPPVIVDSVSYGRIIYVKIETSNSDRKSKATLEAHASKLNNMEIDLKGSVELKEKLEDLSMNVYVLGGGSQAHIDVINAKDLQDVKDIIIKNSKFDKSNLGFPISYSCEFVKDNSRALVQGTTDYVETTREIRDGGRIKLTHSGGYVAQFAVTWLTFQYDPEGKKHTEYHEWRQNWKDKTAGFSEEIDFPGNTEGIWVYARACTFLAWDWWRKVFERHPIPLIPYREINIKGTSLNSWANVEPAIPD